MTLRRSNVCLSALIFLWFLIGTAGASQLAVIVDKSNSSASMSTADLSRIFKLGTTKWQNGNNIFLVLPDPSSSEMQLALRTLFKMDANEFRVFMSAHPSSIVIAKSEAELIKSVQSIPGAIGLVDVYSITGTVNVLKVDGKLPLEPGYTLRGN